MSVGFMPCLVVSFRRQSARLARGCGNVQTDGWLRVGRPETRTCDFGRPPRSRSMLTFLHGMACPGPRTERRSFGLRRQAVLAWGFLSVKHITASGCQLAKTVYGGQPATGLERLAGEQRYGSRGQTTKRRRRARMIASPDDPDTISSDLDRSAAHGAVRHRGERGRLTYEWNKRPYCCRQRETGCIFSRAAGGNTGCAPRP